MDGWMQNNDIADQLVRSFVGFVSVGSFVAMYSMKSSYIYICSPSSVRSVVRCCCIGPRSNIV